ncbi:MAG TPA: AMIN domain-containing protein [Candidatus Deferrimicrobiaceae bacterium]|nr:AMIN domain-containing protein [Candidatus Deferrimicrobiaceae bacterium]
MGQKTSSVKPEITTVTSVRVVIERGVPALEILSTQPAVPSIQFLKSPPRLVVDLLHAQLGLPHKRGDLMQDVQQKNILAIRAEQFQENPPIARIVLDLLAPYSYTWDEAGNRLMVRLRAAEENAAKKATPRQLPTTLTLRGKNPEIVPASEGAGDITVEGSQIAAGSSLTTGPDTTVLRLSRGGEVRICPRTTVSVTPSKNANDLMLGMSSGALETHYKIQASADTVLTPDFRILFAGPGEFDFAISTDSHGNTCVRGLAGNASSATVAELLGDRTYQVKPAEQAVFRAGQIDKVDRNVPVECGCPPPTPVMRTEATSPASSEVPKNAPLTPGQQSSKAAGESSGGGQAKSASTGEQTFSTGSETRPVPTSRPNDVHVQVDAPLIFQAKTRSASAAAVDEAATLPVIGPTAQQTRLEIQIQPPPAAPQGSSQPYSAPRRFLRRLKGMFVAIFS